MASDSTPRFFYGWIIVACTWLANFTTAGTNPLVFAFFIAPMTAELHVGRSELVIGITLRMIAGGLFAPVLGRIIDRYGARWPGVIAGAIVAVTLIGFSVASNIWTLYALFVLSGFSGFSTNTVSGRLNSRAMACICPVSSASASSTTASGLPASRRFVNTSSV